MTQDTTPTSGADDLPEALIHAGMQALLQCTASELENLSPTLFEGYAGDVQRVFVAMTGKALSAALAAGQATAAQAQPAAQQGAAYAALPEPLAIDWPELHSQALGCGVEDRGLHNRYECAEYGWQDGVDKCAERVPEQIFDADQMRAFADATYALRASHGQAPAQAIYQIWLRGDSNSTWMDATREAYDMHPYKTRRIVYTPSPQAAPAAGAVAGPTSMPPSAFLNAAGIKADDMPGTVVRKLDAAFHEAVTFADAAPTPAAQEDTVLYDPKAVLDVFHSARAGSEKPVGYLRGILAVIAHWESRPEPHRWMVPARADSVQEDAMRYRWLREGNDAKHGAAWHVAVNLYGFEWDAAIDAARAAQKEKP